MPKDWIGLGDNEKIAALTNVLTLAGSDLKYRDQCLMSPTSARAAVEKGGDVTLPPGMEVRFMNVDEMQRWIILRLPEYQDPSQGVITVPADKKNWPCTYTIYSP
jgi:hypothetical protein